MSKKLHIKTWGCQMNVYDSNRIADLLNLTDHYILTDQAIDADVLLLNTCSIREKAQEKVFHQLGRWKRIKERNPNVIIAVGGCVAAQEGEKIRNRAKYVDITFGPQTLHRLPDMIHSIRHKKKPIIDISFPSIEKFDYLPAPTSIGPTAFVSIMEGCNKYCSFCVVPYTRGQEVYRPCEDILAEIDHLARQGVREVNLLGQNVNAYRAQTFNNEICSFSDLLRLVSEINGIERIRFTTSHPIEFTDDIIDAYIDIPKLVSFLHLPIQSGSDRILTLMKRDYTVLKYKEIIQKLRFVRPDIQISSDFIIGFPGETQQDFKDTLNLIQEINFDMSYSFIYSPRPGTPAADLPDLISLEEKKNRLYLLQENINKNALIFSNRLLGSIQRILVEGVSKKNIMQLSGRTIHNRLVHFNGSKHMIGKFVDVKIVTVFNHSLEGVVIRTEESMNFA